MAALYYQFPYGRSLLDTCLWVLLLKTSAAWFKNLRNTPEVQQYMATIFVAGVLLGAGNTPATYELPRSVLLFIMSTPDDKSRRG